MSNFIKGVETLYPEVKLIGYNPNNGVYNYVPTYQGGINQENELVGAGVEQFVIDKSEQCENFMSYSFVQFHMKHLMGEVLTTLEASIEDKEKLKAVKSIIKKDFSAKLNWIYENCGCPEHQLDDTSE